MEYYKKSLSYQGTQILNDRRDWTFEAVIVAYADEIAQRHHDIEDGIYAGIIDIDHLYGYLQNDPVFKPEIEKIPQYYDQTDLSGKIRTLSRMIVNFYVSQYSESLYKKIKDLSELLGIDMNCDATSKWKNSFSDYIEKNYESLNKCFGFSKAFVEADKNFEQYLRNHVVFSELAQSMDGKADYVIRQLVKAYLTNPQQLPDKTVISVVTDWYNAHNAVAKDEKPYMTKASIAREKLKDLLNKNDVLVKRLLLRRICDFIAGMTDQYAFKCFESLYGVKQPSI